MSSEEKQLIEQSLEGDRGSFEKLFKMYGKQIKSTLLRLSNNEFDSNDLFQDTFIKAFTNLDKYDPKYPFGTWMNAIARNTFLDYVRRNNVKNRVLLVDTDRVSEMEVADVSDSVSLSEQSDELMYKIAALDDKYREVMELRYGAGLGYKEIAEKLELSIDTVKTRIRRGKEKLK